MLIDSFNGKRLNSPNDVVVKSDGSIWFTDPTFGLLGNYEGYKADPEIDPNVYRLDPQTGKASVVAEGVLGPNGLAFSPDERKLYIVDTGYSHGEHFPRHVRVFDVDGAKLSGGAVFAESQVGMFDGLRVDTNGNVWTSSGDGVRCYAPDGTLIGIVRIPGVVANCCFGGARRNRLFICGTTSLYATYLNARGAV